MRAATPSSQPPLGTGLAFGHPLARGLWARFLFNEGAGTRASNLALPSGGGFPSTGLSLFDGTLINMDPSTDWVPTARGYVLDFDGVDDGVRLTSNRLPRHTLLCRFRTSASQTNGTLLYVSDGTGVGFGASLYLNSTNQIKADCNASTTTITTTFNDGLWHQAAVVCDGSVTLYFDGASAFTNLSQVDLSTDSFAYVGRNPAGTRNFVGQVSDVRIYNRLLSAAEIAALYNNPYADCQRPTYFFRRSDRTHATLEIEAQINGDWIDITSDVVLDPGLTCDYGISGGGALDLVASTGSLSFALRNDDRNSAGLLGYYSPGHANCRSGFKLGIGVRIRYTVGGVGYYKFTGFLDSIDPAAGLYQERLVKCSAVDLMDDYARNKVKLPTQINKRADEVLDSLVEIVPRKPNSKTYDTADSTFAYAFDSAKGGPTTPALSEIQRIAQSELGRVALRGGYGGGANLRFERRGARLTPSAVVTYNDSMVQLSVPQTRGLLYNKAKVTIHPRRVDTLNTTVLFTNTSTPQVQPGETAKLTGSYQDPTNPNARVGGIDMIDPVATTDYVMTRRQDGGGTDFTSFFTVSAAYGGNSVDYSITNNHPNAAAYVTKLQARGRGLYDYDPVEITDQDDASIALYGETELPLDMAYQTDTVVASAVASYLVGVTSTPSAQEAELSILCNGATEIAAAMVLEPCDVVRITESVTGVSALYTIHRVSVEFNTGSIATFKWTLQRAINTSYWLLGVGGRSELGSTTILAPL